jgi:hypothetical protein
MRVALALLGLLAGAANAQSVPSADVLLTMPITIDGSLRDLKLLRGESFEDAAMSFVRSNGLANAQDDTRTRQVVDQLSGLLKTRMHELQTEEAATRQAERPAEQPRVQLSIPLTIEGRALELAKYEGETTEAAVERFLYGTGFGLDAMRELYPQLVALVNQKLDELQPPRKQQFEFSLTIDGREATARHFEGGRPLDEAMDTLRAIGVSDGEFMDRVAPQIANEILTRMNAAAATDREQAAREQAEREQAEQQELALQQQQQLEQAVQQQQPQRRELFSLPLTLGERAAVLVHYDGVSARESAVRFLSDNGVADAETVNSLVPQLVELIDNRMGEILQQEAQQAAAVEQQQQEEQRQRELEQQQQQMRTPLVSLPINLGGDRSATLEYFDGDSVERTVQTFLVGVGVSQEDANFAGNTAQLVSLVQERLAALQQQQQQVQEQEQPAPLFTLPVTLSGRTFELTYVAGQEPAYVANTFCVEKHELIRAELGVAFDGNQLRECQSVLVGWIRERLGQQQQPEQPEQPVEQQATPPQQQAGEQQATGEDARGALLFALDIDMGDGSSRRLPFHRNDHPATLAARFCQQHRIDPDNIPALVEAMQAQLAQL